MLIRCIRGLADIIWPKNCLICKAPLGPTSVDKVVCLECWSKVRKNPPPFCHFCGRHLEKKNLNKGVCAACIKKQPYFDRAFSPCQYEGVIKELIHAFKYKGKDYLGRTLSRPMLEFIREYSVPMDLIDCIVPVPLHKTRLREREFNQAYVLSKCIATQFNKKVLHKELLRLRYTRPQVQIAREERRENVRGSFGLHKKNQIKSKNILLVDDVLTTGQTASWAAYALKRAGANVVFVLTVAN
jgi:competence protein ComFC